MVKYQKNRVRYEKCSIAAKRRHQRERDVQNLLKELLDKTEIALAATADRMLASLSVGQCNNELFEVKEKNVWGCDNKCGKVSSPATIMAHSTQISMNSSAMDVLTFEQTSPFDSDYEDEPELIDPKQLENALEIESKATKKRKSGSFKAYRETLKWHGRRYLEVFKDLIGKFSRENADLQAVVIIANPDCVDPDLRYNVIGTQQPLKSIVRSFDKVILSLLEETSDIPNAVEDNKKPEMLFELPPLTFKGVRSSVTALNQCQLRTLIPLIIKYSTGRQKPFYGRQDKKPCWWPDCVPWRNIRLDTRNKQEKLNMSWTDALRQIVINCYTYHNRLDLLQEKVRLIKGSDLGCATNQPTPKLRTDNDDEMGASENRIRCKIEDEEVSIKYEIEFENDSIKEEFESD